MCLDFELIQVMFFNKITMGRVAVWFTPNHGNGERHLQRRIYPPCEKPHTQGTQQILGGPNFYLGHPLYTQNKGRNIS